MKRTGLRILVAVATALVVALPVAATGAISLWDDVPHDSIFVEYTNWMKVTGLSQGCNPPDYTEYCPEEFVKRQQMAVFMERLSTGQIVDAATAITAEMAELAEEAWFADDADLLDGLDSTEIMAYTVGTDVFDIPAAPGDTSHNILSIDAFDVPASGGVLTIHGNLEAYIAPTDIGSFLGFVWTDVGGDGSCETPIPNPGHGGFVLLRNGATPETTISIVDSTSTVDTNEVPAGPVRIDLCVAGVGDLTPQVGGALSATWSPSGEVIASVSSTQGVTWQDILAPYASVFAG